MAKLEYSFSIKRVEKIDDKDYIEALKIYNDTTPPDIKTSTNQISYWLSNQNKSTDFEMFIFALYLGDNIIGFSMMTYLKKTQVCIIEYIALYNQYRVNTVFFAFINLMRNFYISEGYDVKYHIVEISNKNEGKSIDKESKFFKKLICLEEFAKINCLYRTLPLGVNDHESSFDANIYIKANDNITFISNETYLNIIYSIYYDYYYTWYEAFLSKDDTVKYKQIIDNIYSIVKKPINSLSKLDIHYMDCPLNYKETKISTAGYLPNKRKNKSISIVILALIALICPIIIIWGYNLVLSQLNISLGSISSLVGAVFSSFTTLFIALVVSRKKL